MIPDKPRKNRYDRPIRTYRGEAAVIVEPVVLDTDDAEDDFGTVPDGPTTTWRDSQKRIRRAKRLLEKAEARDAAEANVAARQAEAARIGAERQAAKQAEADEWTDLFARHGLPISARVQTTRWSGGVPDPEIWLHAEGREDGWAKLVDLLRGLPE